MASDVHAPRWPAARAAASAHQLNTPSGWWALDLAEVERPVIVGPGGVFVLVRRHHDTRSIGLDDPSPWPDRRHRMSAVRVAAELASQVLAVRSGVRITVRPLVVVDTTGATTPERPDHVDVVGEEDLGRWLQQQPHIVHERLVRLLVAACQQAPLPPAA